MPSYSQTWRPWCVLLQWPAQAICDALCKRGKTKEAYHLSMKMVDPGHIRDVVKISILVTHLVTHLAKHGKCFIAYYIICIATDDYIDRLTSYNKFSEPILLLCTYIAKLLLGFLAKLENISWAWYHHV
jgi:hypothetical protein